MSDKNSFEVAPGPWGMEKKANGRVEVNLPGDVMVLKGKPNESGGLYFLNGEKVVVVDEINKNGVGVDVNVHGEMAKTELNIDDFKPTIEADLVKATLERWPEGSRLYRNLIVHGDLVLDGVKYRVLKSNGEPVPMLKDHYLYIPVAEGNRSDFSDK